MVLKCELIIELVWVEKYGKREKNHHFWEILRGGTGTEFSVPVPNALFWTSFRILTINWSFLIRFK